MTKTQVKPRPGTGLLLFLQDIKIEHSLFALPFAAASLLYVGAPQIVLTQVLSLLLCMVSARSFAMGANRLIDHKIDRENPRTSQRQIAKGALASQKALFWTLVFGLLFVVGAGSLCHLAFYLSFPVLLILAMYPLLKRITFLCHWYLGFCLGLSVLAVEVALTHKISLPFLCLALAITFWTAGFDLVYSILDIDFDRRFKLHSFPAHFGQKRALLVSKICFVLNTLFLTMAGYLLKTSTFYYLGVCLICLLLFWIHHSIDPEKMANKNTSLAFLGINTWVGPCFLLFAALDRFYP